MGGVEGVPHLIVTSFKKRDKVGRNVNAARYTLFE